MSFDLKTIYYSFIIVTERAVTVDGIKYLATLHCTALGHVWVLSLVFEGLTLSHFIVMALVFDIFVVLFVQV